MLAMVNTGFSLLTGNPSQAASKIGTAKMGIYVRRGLRKANKHFKYMGS
jgi:hypothetical protein